MKKNNYSVISDALRDSVKINASDYIVFSQNNAVFVLDKTGSIFTWGSGTIAGTGSPLNLSTPTSVSTNKKYKKAIPAGNQARVFESAVALDVDGYAWAWGNNAYGQLGNNSTTTSLSPVSVVGGRVFTDIFGTGDSFSDICFFGLDANGYAWAWGNALLGILGTNSAGSSSSPTSVAGGKRFSKIFPGYLSDVNMALDLDGYAWAWGWNFSGQLGNSASGAQSSPVSVLGDRRFSTLSIFNLTVLALDLDGYAWAWGVNDSGQLGNNSTANASSPVSVLGGRRFSKIIMGSSTAYAIDLNGYAWAWGQNTTGQLGNNSAGNSSSPVSVVGDRRFSSIVQAGPTAALDLNGYVWTWGPGTTGSLGNNSTAHASSPVSVLGNRQFTSILTTQSTGNTHYAIDSSGQIWAWGYGVTGMLGNNTGANVSSPVSVFNASLAPTNVLGKRFF